ncbi:hypothetical protein [Shewanella sp.]|uniref:hypothetical protein n=1 Tax=Shewanella sp. TaxID=50422 RepID=UPI003D0AB228
MTHATYPTTGTKQLPATSVSPLEQSGSNKNDIQQNAIKEAVPVKEFRTAIDHLFDLVNVHYHACVGNDELNDFIARLVRNHAKLSGLTCKRAKPYDIEQYELALAAAEARYHKVIDRIMQKKRVLIPEQVFLKVAAAADKSGTLKQRKGEFGPEYAIFLNGHMMMKSEVNCDGEREYFKYY